MTATLLLALTLQVQPPKPPDRWFGPDKIKHFLVATFIQSVGYSALRATRMDHRSSMIGATAGSVIANVGKEMVDARRTGLFSRRDLVWDAAGAGTATLLLGRIER
jgi:putative lipoprotein